MAANIELKYFNTFWLKKIKTIADVKNELDNGDLITASLASVSSFTFTISPGLDDTLMNVGQQVTMTYTNLLGVVLEYKMVNM